MTVGINTGRLVESLVTVDRQEGVDFAVGGSDAIEEGLGTCDRRDITGLEGSEKVGGRAIGE